MSSTINRCFKARCPDQISGRMLKFTAASIDTAVTKLFNQSTSNVCSTFVTGIHFLHSAASDMPPFILSALRGNMVASKALRMTN